MSYGGWSASTSRNCLLTGPASVKGSPAVRTTIAEVVLGLLRKRHVCGRSGVTIQGIRLHVRHDSDDRAQRLTGFRPSQLDVFSQRILLRARFAGPCLH